MKGYTVYCVSSQLCLCWRRSQMQCDVGHGDQTTELVSTSVTTRSPHGVSLKMNINCCIFSLQFLPLHHVAVQGYNFFDTVRVTLIGWMYWELCNKYILLTQKRNSTDWESQKVQKIIFSFKLKWFCLSQSGSWDWIVFAKCIFALCGHKPP